MKKTIIWSLFVSSAILLTLTLSQPAKAQTCGQYGTASCPPTELTINKLVKNPITGEWKENLLDTDAVYSPNTKVTYLLKITNNSNQALTGIKVTDLLPEDRKLVNPVVAEVSKNMVTTIQNPDNRTLLFTLKDALKPGETRDVQVETSVNTQASFTKELTCGVANTAQVMAENKAPDSDSASICILTKVLGTTTLPKAGPEDYLPLLPFVGMGITGLALFLKRQRPEIAEGK